MAVSKRLRYEVLRRDLYTCRYCGVSAPWAVIVVDHVWPRKHRGKDTLENLVAACEPCNNGKAAALPEHWLVEEIEQAAREWRGDAPPEPDEDDLREMQAYQDALYELEALPSAEVLHYIARAFAAAMPYRPTHEELIRCAGMMSRNDAGKRAGATGAAG